MAIYILWIPCLSEDSVKVVKHKIQDHNISDTDVNSISADIDETSFDIKIQYTFKGQEQSVSLKLKEKTSDGFLIYEMVENTENESSLIMTMQKEIHPVIYHIIKEFFHSHCFHNNDEDSILHARFFKDDQDYKKHILAGDDNVSHYIHDYYHKFQLLYEDIIDKISALEEFRGNILKYRDIYKGYKRILDLINRFFGEYLYFDYLSNHADATLQSEISEIRMWKRALTIQKENTDNMFTYNTAMFGTQYSVYGLLIGILGFIISIISLF